MNKINEFDEEGFAVPIGKPDRGTHGMFGTRILVESRVRIGDVTDYLTGKRTDLDLDSAVAMLHRLYLHKKRWRSKYKVLRHAVETEADSAERRGDTSVYDLLCHILDETADDKALVSGKCDSCSQMLLALQKAEHASRLFRKLRDIEGANPQIRHELSSLDKAFSELEEAFVLLRQCDGWYAHGEIPKMDDVHTPKGYVSRDAASAY